MAVHYPAVLDNIQLRDWSLIKGRGGGHYKRELGGGGRVKFYPYERGGGGLAMLKGGGHKSFGVVFM